MLFSDIYKTNLAGEEASHSLHYQIE